MKGEETPKRVTEKPADTPSRRSLGFFDSLWSGFGFGRSEAPEEEEAPKSPVAAVAAAVTEEKRITVESEVSQTLKTSEPSADVVVAKEIVTSTEEENKMEEEEERKEEESSSSGSESPSDESSSSEDEKNVDETKAVAKPSLTKTAANSSGASPVAATVTAAVALVAAEANKDAPVPARKPPPPARPVSAAPVAASTLTAATPRTAPAAAAVATTAAVATAPAVEAQPEVVATATEEEAAAPVSFLKRLATFTSSPSKTPVPAAVASAPAATAKSGPTSPVTSKRETQPQAASVATGEESEKSPAPAPAPVSFLKRLATLTTSTSKPAAEVQRSSTVGGALLEDMKSQDGGEAKSKGGESRRSLGNLIDGLFSGFGRRSAAASNANDKSEAAKSVGKPEVEKLTVNDQSDIPVQDADRHRSGSVVSSSSPLRETEPKARASVFHYQDVGALTDDEDEDLEAALFPSSARANPLLEENQRRALSSRASSYDASSSSSEEDEEYMRKLDASRALLEDLGVTSFDSPTDRIISQVDKAISRANELWSDNESDHEDGPKYPVISPIRVGTATSSVGSPVKQERKSLAERLALEAVGVLDDDDSLPASSDGGGDGIIIESSSDGEDDVLPSDNENEAVDRLAKSRLSVAFSQIGSLLLTTAPTDAFDRDMGAGDELQLQVHKEVNEAFTDSGELKESHRLAIDMMARKSRLSLSQSTNPLQLISGSSAVTAQMDRAVALLEAEGVDFTAETSEADRQFDEALDETRVQLTSAILDASVSSPKQSTSFGAGRASALRTRQSGASRASSLSKSARFETPDEDGTSRDISVASSTPSSPSMLSSLRHLAAQPPVFVGLPEETGRDMDGGEGRNFAPPPRVSNAAPRASRLSMAFSQVASQLGHQEDDSSPATSPSVSPQRGMTRQLSSDSLNSPALRESPTQIVERMRVEMEMLTSQLASQQSQINLLSSLAPARGSPSSAEELESRVAAQVEEEKAMWVTQARIQWQSEQEEEENSLKIELRALKSELNEARTAAEERKDAYTAVLKDLKTEREEIAELRAILEEEREIRAVTSRRLAEMESSSTSNEFVTSAVREAVARKEEELSDALMTLQLEVSELKEDLQISKSEQESLKLENSQLEDRLVVSDTLLENARIATAVAEGKHATAASSQELNDLRSLYDEQTGMLHSARNEVANLNAVIIEKQSAMDALKERASLIDEELGETTRARAAAEELLQSRENELQSRENEYKSLHLDFAAAEESLEKSRGELAEALQWGRLSQEEVELLKAQVEEARRRFEELEDEWTGRSAKLQRDLTQTRELLAAAQLDASAAKEETRDTAAALSAAHQRADGLLEEAHEEVSNLKAQLGEAQQAIEKERQRCAALQSSLDSAKAASAEAEASAARLTLEMQGADLARQTLETASKQKIAALEDALMKESFERKRVFNRLQDAKGKIRVFARLRPIAEEEGEEAAIADDTLSLSVRKAGVRKDFTFDRVFAPDASQSEVFGEVDGLMRSVVDGYNVCLFAYGQTGAGKSHTMLGSADQPGIAPRAVEAIFHQLTHSSRRIRAEVKCSMMELYMDTLSDLLVSSPKERVDLSIKLDPSSLGMSNVPDATQVSVKSAEECLQMFQRGLELRRTSLTQMNAASSRSHLVFSVVVSIKALETGERSIGKLTLIDLAGSERSDKSGTTGLQQKEGTAINVSLTALGDVMASLAKKEKHVPYRNHKLTMLMADSLGGTAKTAMFVNLSPSASNVEETLTSLSYASRVRNVTIGDPKRNAESALVAKLTARVAELEGQLLPGERSAGRASAVGASLQPRSLAATSGTAAAPLSGRLTKTATPVVPSLLSGGGTGAPPSGTPTRSGGLLTARGSPSKLGR